MQQEEFEKSSGNSYVYVYKTIEEKLVQQSKGLEYNSGERTNLICICKDGRMVSGTMMAFVLKKNGLNAHSFRHTHATILIENGATAKGVASRLGHSNANITQNLYTHNTRKLQEDTATFFTKNLQTNS